MAQNGQPEHNSLKEPEGLTVEHEKTLLEDVPLPKDIGHLEEGPTEIVCPACEQKSKTKVFLESVTCMQILLEMFNYCLCCNPIKWSGRFDNNHYCSKCGCYIGRHITVSAYKRAFFKMQRNEVEGRDFLSFQRVGKKDLDDSKMGLRQSAAT